MADVNFGGQDNNLEVQQEQDSILTNDTGSETNLGGGTATIIQEQTDPNKITVVIADTTTPIVVLFGPPACGKTMTLVRLARYLNKDGYCIKCDRKFRPTADAGYEKLCKDFDAMVASDDAANSTNIVNFLLVQVIDGGNVVCQILEAPGEHYFNRANPTEPFPRYVEQIIGCNNRKIWCFMVEPDWLDASDRTNYVSKIRNLKSKMQLSDKSIFVFNKIDKTPYVLLRANVNIKAAKKNVADLYPGIFTPFRRKRILFGYSDDFEFVPFQTGTYQIYHEGSDNRGYTESPDEYPRHLWNTILKLIKG